MCKHLLKDAAFNSLQDRICLQNSVGGEQTHSQPSVYYALFDFVELFVTLVHVLYMSNGK